MTTLGPFRLLSVAGRGGNGEVYAAEHESGLPVAIKVLPRRSSALGLHEIRATAALRHPNVVQVFDYGEVPEDSALAARSIWYAMEWAGGGTLADGAPLSWPALRHGFAGLLSALAWLHARGQLHRDLKPSNVLLPGPSDPRGGWKLTDFGISWTRDSQPSPESGTPHYMAPEQLFRGRLGSWTDLYGFGALVWTVLTGRLAFPGQGPELVEAILNRPPGPFVPRLHVPDAVYPWLQRLLAKQAGARYQYAIEALEDMPAVDGRRTANTPVPVGVNTRFQTPTIATPTWGVVALMPAPTGEIIVHAPRAVPVDPPAEPAMPPRINLPAVSAGLIGLTEPPFVGHERSRKLLWDALRTCFEGGTISRVAITGPSGSGRRRLAHWLAESAHVQGLCGCDLISYRNSPEDGLVGWMRRVFGLKGLIPRTDLGEARAVVQAWIEGRRPNARDEAWVALVEALDAEGPRRVIILDNAEQSEDTSAFLDWVAERMPRPWLVLEVRDDAKDRPEIRLDPLPHADLVRLGLGLGLSPVAATRLAEHSGGSPGVFVDLCVRLTRSDGWLYTEPGLEVRGPLNVNVNPPETQAGSDEAVALAAVLAPEIDIDEWQEGCRLLGLDPVVEMGPLLSHLLVAVDAETWRFRHAANARALLTRVPDLGTIHAIAAQVIRGDDPITAERRAAHQVEAGLLAEARPTLIRAAERAMARFDMPGLARAADLLALAAEHDPVAQACERYCRGKLARWRGQPSEDFWLSAERYVEHAPEWVVRCRIERALLPVPGPRSPAGRALAEGALALALQRGSPGIQVEARLFLAKILLNLDAELSLAHAEEAIRDATSLQDDRLLADAATVGGAAEVFLHRPERAEEKLQVGLAAATRAGIRSLRGVILSEIANVHHTTGKLELALAEYEEASAELGRLAHFNYAIVEASRALIELELGRDDDARRRLESVLYVARARKMVAVAIIQLSLLPWDARERNWSRWDERWQDVRRILDTPYGDPEVARVAESAAAAAEAAGDPIRAADVLAIARHVGA